VISRATKSEVIQKIGSVSAAGGTEVKAGLIEAYRQIATFKSALSRLVLITDGQSEASQLTPETLATQARVSPIQGSRISVIGIGHDVEERSLRSIAEHGKGAYYFAENAKALTRFILDDARSFINPVAESAELTLSTANGFAIRRIYGYEKSQASGGETHIPLHDINVDDWRVIVAEVEKTDPSPGQFEPVTASISYVPFGKKGSSRISKSGRISWAAPGEKTEINPRTARNAVILADAMALVKVSQLSKVSSYQEASGILATQIANVRAARALGDSRSMAKEEAALLRTKRIVDARAGEQALKVADQPEIAPDREAAKVLLRDALQVIGRVTPGPWSLILSLFGAAL
jgi:Ca-activated chloride channel family protein